MERNIKVETSDVVMGSGSNYCKNADIMMIIISYG